MFNGFSYLKNVQDFNQLALRVPLFIFLNVCIPYVDTPPAVYKWCFLKEFFFIPLMCTRRAQYSTTRKSSGMEIKLKKYLKHLNIYLYFRNVLLYQTRLFHNLFPGIRKLVYLIYCLPANKQIGKIHYKTVKS